MSDIDFDLFLEWAKDRFGEENLRIKHTPHGDEICTHSPWSEDKIGKTDVKYHLWMNPSGGKSKHGTYGSYRCWLTDMRGSLLSLVSKIDHCSWEEAEDIISGAMSLRALERKVDEYFGFKASIAASQIPELVEDCDFPEGTFEIDKMRDGYWKTDAIQYLESRKMPTEGFHICTYGDYKHRIIIPYLDESGKVIFWNARTMSKDPKVVRYMKPKEGNAERFLYMTSWPSTGSKIHITEGEFDAKSLALAGFNGCACGGKSLSETQIELLRGYRIVLAFDSDNAGLIATKNIGDTLLANGFSNVEYVRPPKDLKDWNKMLTSYNSNAIKSYALKYAKPFTEITASQLLSYKL